MVSERCEWCGREEGLTDLKPEGSSLSDGGKLSGLEVGESEGGKGLVLLSEVGESRDDDGELVEEETETVSEEDEIGVAVGEEEGSVRRERAGREEGGRTR